MRAAAGVYLLRVGDTSYIGASTRLVQRRCEHQRDLREGVHANPALQRAYTDCPEIAFDVLLYCEPTNLHMYERIAIQAHPEVVNVQILTETGFQQPNVVRQKISTAFTGRELLATTKQKLRAAALKQHAEGRGGMLGKQHSASANAKRVETRRKNGTYVCSEETRCKIRESVLRAYAEGRGRWRKQ